MPLNSFLAIVAMCSRRLFRLLSVILLGSALLLTACFDDDDSADTAAPTAEIHFPGYFGLTDGDTVLVTGSATDASEITRVRVAGVDATSDDGFATWRATVPLEPGDNVIEVETTDEFSNIDTAAATLNIESSLALINPGAIALDSANNRLLIVENYSGAVVAFDMVTGKRTILSETTNEPWVNTNRSSIVLDPARNRALLLDGTAVIAVDLDSGGRSVLSENINPGSSGSDNQLQDFIPAPELSPQDITLDATNDRALLVVGDDVVAVDLENGVRTVLSAAPPPDGGPFPMPNGLTAITLDAANDRALVTDAGMRALVAVDLESGVRSVLSATPPPDINGGPILELDPLWLYYPRDIMLDAAHNRVLVVNGGSSNLIAIDLTTGVRSNFSDREIPDTRYPFEYPSGIALDSANNRALVLDSQAGIIAVDLVTGGRIIAYDRTTPDVSNAFGLPFDIMMDAAHNRALVVDNQLQAVLAMDLTTGARTVLSDNTIPDTNSPFESPFGITLDPGNNRALVVGWSGVLAVDLDTGARTILSNNAIPDAANPLIFPTDIALDAAHNRALVTTQGMLACGDIYAVCSSLVSVDLDTGVRTILSDGATPDESNSLALPIGIDLDATNDRALVADAERMALVAVDLESGARTGFSSSDIPDANNRFSQPVAIAVDSAHNRALVVDRLPPFLFITKSITSVDLVTGVRTILSDGLTPDANNSFFAPTAIALDAEKNRALLVDGRLKAVIAMELTTGERVIISR